ncbi:MAG TPA: FAD-dependent monooxygenase [Vicinamibacterales bacterium]|nr:FAD-dependent monooxygenase [Vicinamibacterales bacterium]
MRITILGGGPAGLYFALLMKQRDASHAITVVERDGPGDTFGWGIVFSDQTFDYLRDNDAASFEAITAACEKWDNVDIVHRGERITVRGNRFSGIARIRFLRILQDRCRELGVDLRFHTPVNDVSALPPADVLVGADGANSFVRRAYAESFGPSVAYGRNKYIWLGTPHLFHGLTLTFVPHATGLYTAHSYKFDRHTSTFIVECGEETWRAAGFERMSERQTCAFLEDVFRDDLAGQPLLTNDFVKWLNFPLVRNARWHAGDVVLLGDALHTAHFSIGSGTKLAVEDAIALAHALDREPEPRRAFPLFEEMRRPRVEQLQAAAADSQRWFENAAQHLHLSPLAFAVEAMTRSGRVDLEKLRQRDPEFVSRALNESQEERVGEGRALEHKEEER